MNLIHCHDLNLGYYRENGAENRGKSLGERITQEYEFDYILSSDYGKMITEGESVDLMPGMFFVRKPGTRVEGVRQYRTPLSSAGCNQKGD